jgi:REP element-mobilizing transposase RayT
MNYNPNIHRRKSIRLKNYDYSQAGCYFVTICTQNRWHLFGEIVDDEMVLNDAGVMVNRVWHEIPMHYDGFKIHQFIVMPNHIHGIIEIVGAGPRACPEPSRACPDTPRAYPNNNMQPPNGQPSNGQPQGGAPTGLGDIVHRYKTLTTKRYVDGVKNNRWQRFNKKLWQRNYWEHIVRNDNEYQRIAQYIMNNPKKWALDKLNGGTGNSVMEPSETYNQEAWMI